MNTNTINSALASLYKSTNKTVTTNQARGAIGAAAQKAEYDTSNPFGFITGRQDIQNVLDRATKDAFYVKRKQGLQDLGRVEDTMVNDRNATIAAMQRSLAGQAGAPGSYGAAAGTALQAALGLGAQQNQNLTAGLQALQGIAEEQRAAMSQNAGLAIDKSNTAKGQQATAANEKYASDATYAATALQALASLFWPGSTGGSGGSGGNNNTQVKQDDEVVVDDETKPKPTTTKTARGRQSAYVYNAGKRIKLYNTMETK